MTHATRPAGRQLAAFAPVTADEDGDQLDLIEEVAALPAVTTGRHAADIIAAAGLHVVDVTHPAPGAVRITVTPGQARAAVAALFRADLDAVRSGDAAVLVTLPDEPAALQLSRLDKGPCPAPSCPLQADHAGPCPSADLDDAAAQAAHDAACLQHEREKVADIARAELARYRAELHALADALADVDPTGPEHQAAAAAFHAIAGRIGYPHA